MMIGCLWYLVGRETQTQTQTQIPVALMLFNVIILYIAKHLQQVSRELLHTITPYNLSSGHSSIMYPA